MAIVCSLLINKSGSVNYVTDHEARTLSQRLRVSLDTCRTCDTRVQTTYIPFFLDPTNWSKFVVNM